MNLDEISNMTDEERRTNELLHDLGALLMDPKMLRITDGLEDLAKFGNRIHLSLEGEDLVALRTWQTDLEDVFASTVKYEFPGRYDSLTLGFRGERCPGWEWNADPELLTEKQARLTYAITASLISLTLDGLVEKLYGQPEAKLPIDKLGHTMGKILQDELLNFLEARPLQELAIDKDNASEVSEGNVTTSKRMQFKIFNAITEAESLGLGLQREIGKRHLLERTEQIMSPCRRHIHDWIKWEESLEVIHVVPAMPLVWTAYEFPKPKRSCLKKYDQKNIRLDFNYMPDPDINDRGYVRFPNLNTAKRTSKSRTASPPPRPDDPDGLRDENRRRRLGQRHQGPPCKPGKPEDRGYERDLEWEKTLPDDQVKPFGGAIVTQGKRNLLPPGEAGPSVKRPCLEGRGRSDRETDMTGSSPYPEERAPNGKRTSEIDGAATNSGYSPNIRGRNWRNEGIIRGGHHQHHSPGSFGERRGRGRGDHMWRGNGGYPPRNHGRKGWRRGHW